MSAEKAESAWVGILNELEASVPPMPRATELMGAGEPGSAPQPGWRPPVGAGPLPPVLAERAQGILSLIEERAQQTRAVQREVERHRAALRGSAARGTATPLYLDSSG